MSISTMNQQIIMCYDLELEEQKGCVISLENCNKGAFWNGKVKGPSGQFFFKLPSPQSKPFTEGIPNGMTSKEI